MMGRTWAEVGVCESAVRSGTFESSRKVSDSFREGMPTLSPPSCTLGRDRLKTGLSLPSKWWWKS